MAAQKKHVGKLKMPGGIAFDPSKMKPGAYKNRKKKPMNEGNSDKNKKAGYIVIPNQVIQDRPMINQRRRKKKRRAGIIPDDNNNKVNDSNDQQPDINKKEQKTKSVDKEINDEEKGDNVDDEHDIPDPFRIHVAIDFGTDGLGLAYSVDEKVFVHSQWNSKKYGTTVKPKTIILIDDDGEVNAFGMDAKFTYMNLASSKRKKWMLFEKFKMALYDDVAKGDDDKKAQKVDIKDELIAVNGIKWSSEKVFIAAFEHLETEATKYLRKKKIKAKKHQIQWIITVPAIWSDRAKDKMKQWITSAGLVDANIPNQCKIVYEPDCASLAIQHCIQRDDDGDDDDDDHNVFNNFGKGEQYILIDAGGGTIDIACHEMLGDFAVKEIYHPSGGPWGSCYIDDQYVKLLEHIFSKQWIDEFKNEAPNVYIEMMHNFQKSKETFYENNEAELHNCRLPEDFICFMDEKLTDENDEADLEDMVRDCKILETSNLVSLDDDYLRINITVWMNMFNYVINPMVEHVIKLLSNTDVITNCKYLCLVGGLSCSAYFQYKMQEIFGLQSKYKMKLMIPQRPILAVVQGAAYFGITKNYIQARRLKGSYGIELYFYKAAARECGISEEYIENNCDWHGRVRGCFEIVAAKNEEIYTNQIKTITSNSFNKNSLSSTIPILYSDEEKPKTKEDGKVLATLHITRNEQESYKTVTEFHFYDTVLTVFSYPEGKSDQKQKVNIAYESK